MERRSVEDLLAALELYEARWGALPGLANNGAHDSLVRQIVESERRNRYVAHLRSVQLSDRPLDPNDELFDPVRAAIRLQRSGELDEAFWMIFLYTHFGKHRRSGYGYARAVYGALGAADPWTYSRTAENISEFRQWLQANKETIRSLNSPGGFGNHRKYESLDGWADKGTGAVFESYIDWAGPEGHVARFRGIAAAAPDEVLEFDDVTSSLASVRRFGRTATFDYVMMANKVGLLSCPPRHAHLKGATGPARGCQLLFAGRLDADESLANLELGLARLEDVLQVGYDILEDAICNWQKSPDHFKPFRG